MSCCCGEPATTKVGPVESENGGKFGTPLEYDPDFKGPVRDRSCTDIICCVIFIIFVLGQAIVAYFALTLGDPMLLILPVNSKGDVCGRPPYNNRTNLFYFDITRCASVGPAVIFSGGKCPTPSVCVTKCPSINWSWMVLSGLEAASGNPLMTERREQLICIDSVNISASHNTTLAELIHNQQCAPYYVESEPVANRCFPSFLIKGTKMLGDAIKDASGEILVTEDNETVSNANMTEGSFIFHAASITQNVINDIVKSWITICLGIGFSVFLTFMYLLLLKFCAGLMVWFTLITFFLAFIASGAYCFYRYYMVLTNPSNTTTSNNFEFTAAGFNRVLDYKEFWLAFGITSAVLVFVILCIIVFLRNRLRLAIGLLEETSKALSSMLLTLGFPIFPLILEIGVIGFWAIIFVYLLSIRTKEPLTTSLSELNSMNSSGNTTNCGTAYYDVNTLHCYLMQTTGSYWSIICQVYNMFVGLWLLNFAYGLGQISLAGAYASWYWAWEKPKDVPTFPLIFAVGRAFRYHLGSLALGSFLIALVQLIRIILEYIDSKVKARSNPLAKFLLCCLKCCFWCLEKLIKFITKNAYIMIAVGGRNFCSSARQAFSLLMRNLVRLIVVDRVTSFVLFIGKLVITGGIVTLSYFFYSYQIPYLSLILAPSNLNYFYVPVILTGVGCFIITCIFFMVYDFAVDTLFLCVLEDMERNDGSPEKPYFMSSNLMRILDKDNKFKTNDDHTAKRSGCCC